MLRKVFIFNSNGAWKSTCSQDLNVAWCHLQYQCLAFSLLKLFLPHRGRGKSVWVSVTTISLREDSLTPHGFYKQSLVCTVDHLFDDLIWTIKATSDNWPLHVELQYVAKTDFSILPPLLLSFLWQSKLKGKAWQHVGCLRCTYHTWATRSTCQ